MKGIYKRGNVYWIRYAGLDGRIIKESSGSDKFKTAETLLLKRRSGIKEGKMPDIVKIENHSFSELATEYHTWAKSQRSYKGKKYYIDQLIDVFGHYPLRRISALLVEQFISERLVTGKKGKPNTPATANRLLALIKHMMTKAAEWQWVERDVCDRIHAIKPKEEPSGRIRFLTIEECKRLINACDGHLKPIVITALNTGCRKQEVLSLTWEQVDLKNSLILLEKTKSGKRRDVPINETVREVLKSQIRRLDVPYVFYDIKSGKRYGEVKRSFSSALNKAKIQDFTFHDLRHTFASHLVMNGVDLASIKELLGHSTLKMTLRYAHLASAHKAQAVKVLDGVFNIHQASSVQKRYNLG